MARQGGGARTGGDDGMGRLADMIAELMGQRGPAEGRYKAPKFDGTQDVEVFIRQFQDVRQANQWGDQAAVLHLRRALTGKAVDCGDSATTQDVFMALRTRFGLTERQAKDRLAQLKKDPKIGVHEFSCQVERLVSIAYAGLPAAQRSTLALDSFCRALDHRAIQRHLLVTQPVNIQAAVRSVEEVMQIGFGSQNRLLVVDEYNDDDESDSGKLEKQFGELLSLVRENSEAIRKLTQAVVGQSGNKKIECYECGGGHLKRNCPNLTRPQVKAIQENEEGPQDTD